MAKKHLEQYDSQGNRLDIYLNKDEVMVGDETLAEKLAGMDQAIQAAAQSGETPDDEMSSTSEKAVQNKVIKAYVDAVSARIDTLIGSGNVQGAIDTFNEVVAFLANISSSDTLAAKLATLVPQTRAINGKALSSNVTIGINDIDGLAAAIANAGSGAVSVTTNQDGTFVIHVGDTDYTINLNHTHEDMAKLVVCEESDLPATLAKDTIYAQVDDADTPTEIEMLYIAGLEFVGGGVPDTGQPLISRPANGTTISLGKNMGSGVSKTIAIKGKNLTGDLTVTASTGLSLTYGQSTGSSVTIPLADALLGVQVTVEYNTIGGLEDGSLLISHNSVVLSAVTVLVEARLPSGYTELEYVDNAMKGIETDIDAQTTPSSQGSKWEVDVQMAAAPSAVELIICSNQDVGHWLGAKTNGVYGISTADGNFPQSVTTRSVFEVEFISKGITAVCNGTTKTILGTYEHQGTDTHIPWKTCLLKDMYNDTGLYQGKIYSVKCTRGGNFHGIPAKRDSDNHFGLYDIENNVFYDLSVAS